MSYGKVSRGQLIGAFNHQSVKTDSRDFVINFSAFIGIPAQQLKIRKTGELLPFMAKGLVGAENEETYYGYCFRE